jgi:hypothetical protein
MGGLEANNIPQGNTAFLDDGDRFTRGVCTDDVAFITISTVAAGKESVSKSSPSGNSCMDISQKKNDSIHYPGRSVLYSRQFRPLNRVIITEYNNTLSGEP